MTSGDTVADRVAECTVQVGISRDDIAGVARVLSAGIGDETASLPDQQNPCGKIPAFQPEFPVAIVPAGRDPGEVQRRSTEPTNAGDLWHQLRKSAGEGQASRRHDGSEGDPGGEQGIVQVATGGDPQATLVDEGPGTL